MNPGPCGTPRFRYSNNSMAKDANFQTTLVLFKPDAIRRGLIGRILTRIEDAGLNIRGMKLVRATEDQARAHYLWEDIGKRHGETVWKNLIDFLLSGPVLALAVHGNGAVEVMRKLCGPTEPLTAPPGTIRGDFSHHGYALSRDANQSIRNVIHASATPEEAERELAVWFDPTELYDYRRCDHEEHFLE